MKVLYIYYAVAIYGGIERVLVDKMNCLANMGYDVFLLTTNQGKHPLPFKLNRQIHYDDLKVRTHLQYQYKGVRRYWEQFWRYSLLYKRLSAKLQSICPDIIVTTTNGYISELAKIKGNTPLVVESHTGFDYLMEDTETSWLRRLQLRRLRKNLHKADVIVVLTDDDAMKWKQHYSCVYVIPNVVHLNVSGFVSSYDNKRVIFVGRNNKPKGIPDLLKIWLMVHSKHPDWQLDMYVERLTEEMIEEIENLNANIKVYPPVNDIMSCFIQSSFLVSSSIYESFSLVIAEAMSCGLPVVSFESDGPRSIITDGENGFLVKGRNRELFADYVCQLIEDKNLRMELGQNAVKSVRRFSAEIVMPKWKELFDSL